MAIIKKNELIQMNEVRLKEKLNELKKEIVKINAKRSTGTTLENSGRVKEVRRTIARILTKMNEGGKAKKNE